MTSLIIQSPLAERIQKIAEQEQRPIEAVLESMIERDDTPLSDEEIDARLRAAGIIVPENEDDDEPPISEEERKKGW